MDINPIKTLPMKDKILADFDSQYTVFNKFKEKCRQLLTDLFDENSVLIHQITGRTKDRTSLSRKIDKKDEKYNALSEITDIVGLRVITYLESDVDKIANVIEKEFKVDRANSTDKRRLKADQFGYRSLHFVLELNDERVKNTEYKSFKGLKVEVQIRSILQHAWAEIEHDLGYKGEGSIPEEFKRGFNRLAALLETADVEFDRLKSGLDQYKINVNAIIATEPETLDINQTTLMSLASNNEILLNATRIISHNVKAAVDPVNADFATIARRLKTILHLGSIKVLQDEIEKHEHTFLHFANLLSKNTTTKRDAIPIHGGLSYFLHFYAVRTLTRSAFREYIIFGFTKPSTTSSDNANSYYNRCRASLTKAKIASKHQIQMRRFKPLLYIKKIGQN